MFRRVTAQVTRDRVSDELLNARQPVRPLAQRMLIGAQSDFEMTIDINHGHG